MFLRPRSVPTVERNEGGRRVGSGRLNIERSDGRPDSRGMCLCEKLRCMVWINVCMVQGWLK